jgi:RNA polymerase sigma-70 factor, ECF subfamily
VELRPGGVHPEGGAPAGRAALAPGVPGGDPGSSCASQHQALLSDPVNWSPLSAPVSFGNPTHSGADALGTRVDSHPAYDSANCSSARDIHRQTGAAKQRLAGSATRAGPRQSGLDELPLLIRVVGGVRLPFHTHVLENRGSGLASEHQGVLHARKTQLVSVRILSLAVYWLEKERNLDKAPSLLLRLLDEYGVRLHALLTKITLREDVAEELLQELFLKLFNSDGFSKAPHPEHYLFRSAINLSFDWRSRVKDSMKVAPLTGQEPCSRPPPLDRMLHREAMERVMLVVEQLPPADRSLVVLRFLDGSSYEELAEQMESTPHRVRAHCSRVMARLRKQLDPGHGKELEHVD